MDETVSGSLPSRFEVDLTSVCVRVGAVQLPFHLQHTFEEGAVTALDAAAGNPLELEFQSPRKLVGFQAFFAAHGLRPNDRIALVFEPSGLCIEAIRRERGTGGKAAAARAKAAAAQGAGEPTIGMGSVSWRVSSELAEEADGARDLPSRAPGSGVPGPSADDAAWERSRADTAPESTRVVRERIRGNAPPLMTRPDFGAGFATPLGGMSELLGSAEGTGKKASGAFSTLPRWEPLDMMAPPDGWPEMVEGDLREAARAQGHVMVREVRRSRPAHPTVPALGPSAGAAGGKGEAGQHEATAALTPAAGEHVTARSTTAQRAASQKSALDRVVAQRSAAHRSAPQWSTPRTSVLQHPAPQPVEAQPARQSGSPQTSAPQRPTPQRSTPQRPVPQRSITPRPSNQRPIAQRAPAQRPGPSDAGETYQRVPDADVPRDAFAGRDGHRAEADRDDQAASRTVGGRLAAVRVGVLHGSGLRAHGSRPETSRPETSTPKTSTAEKLRAEAQRPGAADVGRGRVGSGRVGQDDVLHDGPLHDGPRHDGPLHDDVRLDDSVHQGRGIDLFGLRRRLRRGRSSDADSDPADAAKTHPFATASQAEERRAYPVVEPGEDFTDAFLEFDDPPRPAAEMDDLAGDRQRPWLPNGEYRPRDVPPPRPVTSRADGVGHPAARGSFDTSGVAEEDELPGADPSSQPSNSRSSPSAARHNAAPMPATTHPGAASTTVSPAHDDSSRAEPAPRASSQQAVSALRPEEDPARVAAYLARPDVPAIVRSELVAEELGISMDRVERVMMRIAEDRERVTRIRPGAYMVRRKPDANPDADPEAGA